MRQNLFRLYFFRLKRSRLFWITFGIVAGYGLLSGLGRSLVNWVMVSQGLNAGNDWSSLLLNGLTGAGADFGDTSLPFMFVLWGPIVGSFIAIEFRNGLISQQIAGGATRKEIYDCGYLGGLAFAFILYAVYFLGLVIGFAPGLGGFSQSVNVGRFLGMIPSILINLIFFYTFIHFIVFMMKGKGPSVVVPFFIILGTMTLYGMLSIIPSIVTVFNPEFLHSEGYEWFFRILFIFFPTAHVGGMISSVVYEALEYDYYFYYLFISLGVDLGYSALFYFLGRYSFAKTDLR